MNLIKEWKNLGKYDISRKNIIGTIRTREKHSNCQIHNFGSSGKFILPETNFTSFKFGLNIPKYNLINNINSIIENFYNHKNGIKTSSLKGNNNDKYYNYVKIIKFINIIFKLFCFK
jgi:hypothetical protein